MSKTLISVTAFGAKCDKASFASKAKSAYDESMYGEIPKELALSRLAVWGAIRDIHKVETVLTDGQITTVIDAAPAIVGGAGLEKLKRVSSHEEMSEFISNDTKDYGPGIMAAAQLWSLFHLTTRTWPDHLFKDSVITDEGAALLGLTSAHLRAGTFTAPDFKPRQFLLGMVAKAHKIAEEAANGKVEKTPQTLEDTSATFIELVRAGKYEAAAFSGLAQRFPESECPPKISKIYKIPRKGGEVDFVRPDDVPADEEFAKQIMEEADPRERFEAWSEETLAGEEDDVAPANAAAGGDGSFLGYRGLTELKIKFKGRGVARAGLSMTDYMKRHPFGHAIICKWYKMAADADFGGAVTKDEVFAAALAGKSEFLEKYSPVFSPGYYDESLGAKKKDEVDESPSGKKKVVAADKKTRAIASDAKFDPDDAVTQFSLFSQVQPFRAARFADSNRFSNKRVQLLFADAQELISRPKSAVFKDMEAQYRYYIKTGMPNDEAMDTAVAESKQAHPNEDNAMYHIWRGRLGRVNIVSLDEKLSDDSLSDRYNSMPHDMLEEYSKGDFSKVVDGQDDAEIEVHNGILDLTDTQNSNLNYLENAFREMHTVLIENDREELVGAMERMSCLSMPSKEELAAIYETLAEGHDSLKTGRALAAAFARSCDTLSYALKGQIIKDDGQAEMAHGVKAAVEAAVEDPASQKDNPPHVRMAARMERVLKGTCVEGR